MDYTDPNKYEKLLTTDRPTIYLNSFWDGFLIEKLKRIRGKRVLDLGCGTCKFTQYLEPENTVGLDNRQEMLDFGAKRTKAKLIKGDALAVPFEDQTFDIITAFGLAEYVDLGALVKEAKRLLKGQGEFLITVPNKWNLFHRTSRMYRRVKKRRGKEERSLPELKRALEEFFEIQEVHSWGMITFPPLPIFIWKALDFVYVPLQKKLPLGGNIFIRCRLKTLDKRPKVVCIDTVLNYYLLPLFRKLSEKYETTVFLTNGSEKGLAVTDENIHFLKSFPLPKTGRGISFELANRLLRDDFDIVICSDIAQTYTTLAFIAAKLRRKKIIVWNETWIWSKSLLHRISFPLLRFIMRNSDALIAAGTKAKEFFLQCGIDEQKISITPDCAEDLNKVKPHQEKVKRLKKELNPNKKRAILYLGRIVPYKNLDCLIKAFAHLEEIRDDVLLLIVGPSDSSFETKCRRLIEQEKLRNYIWLGPVPHEDVMYYYIMCDIFVQPGRFIIKDRVPCESWGMVINEAMSLGKPIISTTSVGGAFDLIKDNGLLVKEGDVEDMFRALKKLVSDDKLRDKMSQRSKEIIKQSFQYHHMSDGFEEAIEYAMNKS